MLGEEVGKEGAREPEGGWEISVSSPNHLEVMIINDNGGDDTLKIF